MQTIMHRCDYIVCAYLNYYKSDQGLVASYHVIIPGAVCWVVSNSLLWLLLWTYGGIFAQSFQWRYNTNFCEGLQFFFVATKKEVITISLQQKPVTPLFSTLPVYAAWNPAAEKGHTHRRGTNPEWFLETSETPLKPPLCSIVASKPYKATPSGIPVCGPADFKKTMRADQFRHYC